MLKKDTSNKQSQRDRYNIIQILLFTPKSPLKIILEGDFSFPGEPHLCQINSNTNMKGKTKIKIKGHLDQKWEDWFDGMEISYDGDNSILTCIMKDEAHMRGILNRIMDLNLELISVNSAEDEHNK